MTDTDHLIRYLQQLSATLRNVADSVDAVVSQATPRLASHAGSPWPLEDLMRYDGYTGEPETQESGQ